MTTPISLIIVVAFATIISALGAISLKKASSDFTLKPKFLLNKYLLLGLFLYGTSTLVYLITLRFGELSILFPTASTVFIWVSLFSQKFLGEKMNALKWIGIFIILLGVVFLALGSG